MSRIPRSRRDLVRLDCRQPHFPYVLLTSSLLPYLLPTNPHSRPNLDHHRPHHYLNHRYNLRSLPPLCPSQCKPGSRWYTCQYLSPCHGPICHPFSIPRVVRRQRATRLHLSISWPCGHWFGYGCQRNDGILISFEFLKAGYHGATGVMAGVTGQNFSSVAYYFKTEF